MNQKTALCKNMYLKKIDAGTEILKKGDTAVNFVVIEKGEVEITVLLIYYRMKMVLNLLWHVVIHMVIVFLLYISFVVPSWTI